MIITINNDVCRVSGHTNDDRRRLSKMLSYRPKGVEHSKKVKAKQWDGFFRLFAYDSFPVGLFSIVKAAFPSATVEDARIQPSRAFKWSPVPNLRGYQSDALAGILRFSRGVIFMTTGAGKTEVAAQLIAERGVSTLFLVPTVDLLTQTANRLERILGCPVGRFGGRKSTEQRPVTVSTYQSASKADLSQVQMLIFDECHHVPAQTCFDIAKDAKAYYSYGLSATPWRDDGHDMRINAACGQRIAAVSASLLIKQGYLVPPEILVLEIPNVTRARKYDQIYTEQIVTNSARHEIVAEHARRMIADGLSVLVLVKQIEHGQALASKIGDCVFLSGKDTQRVRDETLEWVRSGKLRCIVATSIADEGLDLPRLDGLILAGGGKSSTKAFQRVGRALRPFEGKTRARVVEFDDQARYLHEHFNERLRLYQTEPEFRIERGNGQGTLC